MNSVYSIDFLSAPGPINFGPLFHSELFPTPGPINLGPALKLFGLLAPGPSILGPLSSTNEGAPQLFVSSTLGIS